MRRVGKQPRRLFPGARYVREESRRAYRLAFILFWSVLLSLICQRYVVGLGIVTETSMQPTLTSGDHYLVNKYVYRLTRPQRGDIVVLRPGRYEPDQYVKRIVGLEGELLRIAAGRVHINGCPLLEPYVSLPTAPDLGPTRLPSGCYFVLGDNRPTSVDSRHFGCVPLHDIEGRITPGRIFAF